MPTTTGTNSRNARWRGEVRCTRRGEAIQFLIAGRARNMPVGQVPQPNTYEDSCCQETDYPYEWILAVFFRFFRSSAVGTRWCVLTAFPYAGAGRVCLHHTLIEALSP